MDTLKDCIHEYRKLLQRGTLQKAYRGLMEYLMGLKTHFQNKYPDYSISGSLYFGYMDMSYFSFFPGSLKKLGLKVAIVFLHESFRFEVWLAGYNKKVQKKYWEHIKVSAWDQYHLVSSIQGSDSILEHVLVSDPDFSDLDALTGQIERKTMDFIKDVEQFLARNPA